MTAAFSHTSLSCSWRHSLFPQALLIVAKEQHNTCKLVHLEERGREIPLWHSASGNNKAMRRSLTDDTCGSPCRGGVPKVKYPYKRGHFLEHIWGATEG